MPTQLESAKTHTHAHTDRQWHSILYEAALPSAHTELELHYREHFPSAWVSLSHTHQHQFLCNALVQRKHSRTSLHHLLNWVINNSFHQDSTVSSLEKHIHYRSQFGANASVHQLTVYWSSIYFFVIHRPFG